jgi:periplasmic divalent cation tolerance protein
MVSQFLQVMTTTDKKEAAGAIAQVLVEKRLAGCVQVLGPITSTYRWEGEIETAEEWLCLAKTRAELYDQVEAAIRDVHPYDVPEILAVPVSQGNPAYLQWLEDETT